MQAVLAIVVAQIERGSRIEVGDFKEKTAIVLRGATPVCNTVALRLAWTKSAGEGAIGLIACDVVGAISSHSRTTPVDG